LILCLPIATASHAAAFGITRAGLDVATGWRFVLVGGVFERFFYEKVIKVKADVAALLSLFSDISVDVQW
jgi:hypothetical protein